MSHTCHHPECQRVVPPRLLACSAHWFQLPRELRQAVWAAYRPGQEIDKKPSQVYMDVIAQVQEYWKERERRSQDG